MTLDRAMAARVAAIQAGLDTHLSAYGDDAVAAAMRHALSGGKRVRGFLAMEGAALHGIPEAVSVGAAVAIEAVHAYSLVHDDLPCMDDDDLRRGQPTVHVKWDEATAVLAGDALQTMAFGCLAAMDLPPERRVVLIAGLAQKAGARGMVLGQAQDIAAETVGRALSLEEITALQANKTGALIEWAATAGPVMADDDTAPLRRYAAALGLAFQIADDILDATGDEAAAGKRLHKDAQAGKATFVSLLGLDGAREKAQGLMAEAEAALAPYGAEAARLKDLARFVVTRDR